MSAAVALVSPLPLPPMAFNPQTAIKEPITAGGVFISTDTCKIQLTSPNIQIGQRSASDQSVGGGGGGGGGRGGL